MLDTQEIGEGTVLADRYEVIERIGSGGMATVYLAEDNVLGRRVAVKRLRSETAGEETSGPRLRRFRREARLGATLSHPNVVTVFDTVAGADGVLIVMEYVEGRTLADVLDDGPLEPDWALEVLAQVAAALEHAHSCGIVHRDVKPANVLLGDDATVKLADLGIATAAEATRITTANDIVGTLAYIAPERLDSDSPGGPEADVFALAVLAYETLTGTSVNRGSTPAEVVHRAAAAAPPDLRDGWPEAPAEAAYALQAGMSRDPAMRPSPSELVDRLTDALADVPEMNAPVADEPLPLPPRPPSVTTHRAGSFDRIPRPVLIALAGLTLAAFVVIGLNLARGGDEPAGNPTGNATATDEPSNKPGKDEPEGPGAGDGAPATGSQPPPQAPVPGAGAPAPTPEPAAPHQPTDGATLNDQGFALIQQGNYDEAIPILQRAVDSYPEGTTDLNYAYALFNLGNALRLAGRPEEAIPILEQRKKIPDQKEIVERELKLAKAEAKAK